MDTVKIMPCLDMKNGKVVKGVHFADLREAGDPVENAAFYQKEGADELAMLDIAATLENRKTRLDWVKQVSSVITIPLTVGGGINSLEDIQLVLEAGAKKVSMNSAAVNNPDLVKEAADRFGSERITIAIDARRNPALPSGFELVVSEEQNRWERMQLHGRECARILGLVLFYQPAWMAMEPSLAMILNLPKPFLMQ